MLFPLRWSPMPQHKQGLPQSHEIILEAINYGSFNLHKYFDILNWLACSNRPTEMENYRERVHKETFFPVNMGISGENWAGAWISCCLGCQLSLLRLRAKLTWRLKIYLDIPQVIPKAMRNNFPGQKCFKICWGWQVTW